MVLGAIIRFIMSVLLVSILVLLIFSPSLSNNLIKILSTASNATLQAPATTTNLSYPTTTIKANYVPQDKLVTYALSLINKDRQLYNLSNVSYSAEPSAQQHSESMLQNAYFSHWDIYGLKPYMRYTILGGNQSIDENIAYVYNSSGVNVTNALYQMEYSMMYNDAKCCNNGHRDNILDPQHNQVSIGVAYNATTVYFTEDFIDDYINWFYGTPAFSNGMVYLNGTCADNYDLHEVLVTYDQPASSLNRSQLKNPPYNASYGYGTTIAGIGYTEMQGNTRLTYSYGNITLNATKYLVQGNKFGVSFNMDGIISRYGAGEYTVMVIINETDVSPQTSFLAATHTFFINGSGKEYIPSDV
jgi:uncharacterized protein YkwD